VPEDPYGVRQDERATLTGFLDWYRGVVARKADGLGREQAGRALAPSGLSVLGVIQHLGWAERLWFRWRFAGEDLDPDLRDDGGNAHTFVVAPDASVDDVLAGYHEAQEDARRIVAAASLDAIAAREHRLFGAVSLRWIVAHMIEETARHAGHLDLMRESIDGRTGD